MQQHKKPWEAVMMAGIVAVWVGLWVMPAFANTFAPVEGTGQTGCWSMDAMSIDCSGTGQDGEIQAGLQWPAFPPRFRANVDRNGDGDCTDAGETCDGTVTDRLTGLTWLKDASCLGKPRAAFCDGEPHSGCTWSEALAAVTALNAREDFECADYTPGTFDDWRLPNIKELQSLIEFGYRDPALRPNHPFVSSTGELLVGQQGYFYWSSTTREDQTYKAWGVDFDEGSTTAHFKRKDIILPCDVVRTAPTRETFGVWAVRGKSLGATPVELTGQKLCWDPNDRMCPIDIINCKDSLEANRQDGQLRIGVRFPVPRFTANVDLNGDGDCTDVGETCDGTVTDHQTGLTWLKNAACLGTQMWQNALNAANGLMDDPTSTTKDCGLSDGTEKGDWRLPNVKELQSLIIFGRSGLALPPGHPFQNVQPRFYHSSTTSERFQDDAWAVSLRNGLTHTDTSEERQPDDCKVIIKDSKCATKYLTRWVWPVKGGLTPPLD